MTVGSPRSSLVASFSRTNLRVNLDGVSVSPSSNFWSKDQAQSRQKADFEEGKSLGELSLQQERQGTEIMSFHLLPYDLLLNIASYLEYVDVHVLQLTCKSLYYSFTTRPVYRKLATDLLRRCRPLPLKGFQRPGDLSTNRLIYSVNKAHKYEHAWLVRAPRPIGSTTAAADTAHGSVRTHNNYLDLESPAGSSAISTPKNWYKVVRAPPGEEVDWLSPITSSYTLCATKSGKVVCWDVQSDSCLAEWNPGERWELWKCRVEFEDKMVYFTMAKVLHGSARNSYDDSRVMEFSLMRLQFYENALGKKTASPIFSPVTSFKSVGVVMNIFLLDPSARLLSAFVWVSNSNTIGLYVLLDWEKDEYVFIDTGIECVMSSNWSCILFERNIVIHCEDSDAAFQHFYPLTLLESHSRRLKTKRETPTLSGRVTPFESIVKRFTFPAPRIHSIRRLTNLNVAGVIPITVIDSQTGAIITVTTSIAAAPHTSTISSNTSTTSAISSLPSSAESSSSSTSSSIATPSSSSLDNSPPIQVLPQPVVQPSTSTPPNFNPNPNPFPFPPWYPESAHFVRQWWPTLSNVPRISCTVVLLASHDPITHKTRFVLAQHYFRVPMRCADWVGFGERGKTGLGRREMPHLEVDVDGVGNNGADGTSNATYVNGVAATAGSSSSSSSTPVPSVSASDQSLGPMEMYFLDGPPEGSVVAPFYENSPAAATSTSASSTGVDATGTVSPIGWTVNGSSSGSSCYSSSSDGTNSSKAKGKGRARTVEDEDEATPSVDSHSRVKNNTTVEDDAMRLWYVSTPFEVVCLEDPSPEDEDGDGVQERPRPLVAVDFGHAVWIEYYDQDGQSEMATAGSRRMHNAPAQHHVEQHQHDVGNVIMQVIGHQHGHIYESVDDDEDKDSVHNSETDVEDGKADDDSETATATDPEEVGFEREDESSAEQDEIREQEFQDHKRLRFVTFPPFTDDGRVNDIHGGWGGAEVRTLEIPPELDLHSVETINIDQSQGAIILSVKQGRIFILCYE
ncbi:hypothetical protein C8R41DRAFT_863696 [Lentinula lateritia]|uniref:F-box domain-containing protein n=1 Tax=Lentinula lateritia TaxID=40482 RepID=A0ABQ8VTN5_9AGAR|nr:hypothetical protein C8R41DRAFT_863696 [Lentinula lateritia]